MKKSPKMQFLTAKSLLYIRVILLFTASFWVASDPRSLFHSNFVLLLGEAMNLPAIPVDEKNPIHGLVSLLLAFLAIGDLIPNIAGNIQYFETVVPTRLFMYFGLCGYAYLVENKYFGNNVVFVYAFLEVWINFVIYNNIRDEKFNRLKNYINEHAEELQNQENDKVRVIQD